MSVNGQKLRNCSVPSPLDTGVKNTLDYYTIGNELPSVSSVVGSPEGQEMCLSPVMRAVLRLCISNSMRIGETLAIRRIDEVVPSKFLVKGQKRSASYTVWIPMSALNRKTLETFGPHQVLFPTSYHSIWRAMNRVGMSTRVTGRVNNIMTHIGRYSLADKLQKLNRTAEIQDALHHRSPKSTQYYLLNEST